MNFKPSFENQRSCQNIFEMIFFTIFFNNSKYKLYWKFQLMSFILLNLTISSMKYIDQTLDQTSPKK
jgi:hypothetical protein